jgi:hypothetical protein
MFKLRISQAEFDKLADSHKLVYVKDGDGYKLPLVEEDDPGPLRRALDRERTSSTERGTKIATLESEIRSLRETIGTKGGDVATLEKSWTDKYNAREAELNGHLDGLRGKLNATLIDVATQKLAGEITSKPEHASLMVPHIRSRYEVVWENGEPILKIKDANGKPSALNHEELKKEFVTNPVFASVVVANRASGAGSGGKQTGGSGGGAAKKWSEMSESERVTLFRQDPAAYREMKAAEGK